MINIQANIKNDFQTCVFCGKKGFDEFYHIEITNQQKLVLCDKCGEKLSDELDNAYNRRCKELCDCGVINF